MKNFLSYSISLSSMLSMLWMALLLPTQQVFSQGNSCGGETWTARSVPNGEWTAVTYGNGLYVAVSYGGTNRVMTSTDGINWTPRTAPASGWVSITYGNGIFVAVANSGTNRVMISSDGINWTGQTASEQSLWSSVTYGNGKFVAVAYSGTNLVMTSTNGTTWTSRSACGNDDSWQSVAYGNGVFVAVANSGDNRVMTSTDGETWTARTGSLSAASAITFGDGKFVGVGSGGSIRAATTTDGISWNAYQSPSSEWYSVAYGNGLYVAVALSGTNRLMTSPNGTSWTARTIDANEWFSVAHGNNLFVAVSYGGTNRVVTSPSALTPSVSLASNDADNSINAGTSVTFTATPTNGGTTPTYAWYKNNTIINGEASATYTTTSLADGDKIKVVMTSNDPCASPTTATSNEIMTAVTTVVNGPSCSNFTNRTTANGLGDNTVSGVYVVGSTVYAATNGGLSISTDGGNTFTTKTTTNGLGGNQLYGLYVVGNTIYAATNSGLSISTDGGNTFITKTTTNGLGNNSVNGVYVTGSTIYASTNGGLSISTDGGSSFSNKTTANGLGNNVVFSTYVIGNTVYAATSNGVSISTDGGNTFTNKTTANGLGNNYIFKVFVVSNTVYAATFGGGLSISTDGGNNFTNKTTSNGLGNNSVFGVYAVGNTVYAATFGGGLSISTDGGNSFTNKTTSNGLGNNSVFDMYVVGNKLYVATRGGLAYCTDCTPVVPSVSIASNDADNSITSGTSVTFTATPTNGGTTPTYAWYKNNTIINGEASATYTTTSLADGDKIKVVMTSNDPCASPTTATSNEITTAVTTVVNGPSCSNFTNRNTTHGLGTSSISNLAYISDIYAEGSTVYAATQGGLSISTDGGISFTTKTTADGLANNNLTAVYGAGGKLYIGTSFSGLNISTDGGNTFTTKTTANGLASDGIYNIYAIGDKVYITTPSGLSISTDGGGTFTNKTTADGLGNNLARGGVYAVGNTIYVGTEGGLSISTDGGATFVNKTTDNGLVSNVIRGVYAVGNRVYVGTSSGVSISTDGGNTFTLTKTRTNGGLGANAVYDMYAVGSTVYASTAGGVSISTNEGISFTNKNYDDGLASNFATCTFVVGNTLYVGTQGGLSFCSACSAVTPSVTLASNDADNSITSGTSVTFTATPTNGGTTPTYAWYKNNTIINGEASATYTTTSLADGDKIKVVMTSNASCASPTTATSNELTMTVTISCTQPTANIGVPSGVKCEGQPITLNASEGTTYSWAFSAGGSFTSTTGSPATWTPNAGGIYTVSLTVNNGTCTASTSTTISVNSKPTASINRSINSVCAGVSITLSNQSVAITPNTANVTNIPPNFSWAVSPGGSFTSTTGSPVTWSSNTTGSYSVTLTVNDGSCSNTASTTVSVNALPSGLTVTGGGEVCPGTSVAVGLASSMSGVMYQLKNGNNNVGGSVPGDGTAISFGNISTAGTYTVVATNSNNCTATMNGSATVTVTTPVGGTASADQNICSGTAPTNNLSLSGNVGNVTKWQRATNANFTGATDISVTSATLMGSTIGNLSTDTWFRAVVQAGTCAPVNSSGVKITILQPHTASINASTIVCTGNAIGLTASPNESGLTYAWSGPGNFSSTLRTPTRPNATLAMSGAYRLTVARPACGFSSTASVSVIATTPNGKAAPRLRALLINGAVAGLGNVYSVCSGAPVTATVAATSGTAYSWNGPNSSSGVGSLAVTAPPVTISNAANANTVGNYTLQIFNGCDRSTTVNFSIRLRNCTSTRLAAAEDERTLDLNINLAPNPVRDFLTASFEGVEGQTIQIQLIDAQGRSRQQTDVETANGKAQHRFDLRSLPAGMYLLQAETATQRAVKKVIKL